MSAGTLAYRYFFRCLRNQTAYPGPDQRVVNNDLRTLQHLQALHGQKPRIRRPRTDKIYFSHIIFHANRFILSGAFFNTLAISVPKPFRMGLSFIRLLTRIFSQKQPYHRSDKAGIQYHLF